MDWPCCHPGANLSWLCSTSSGFDDYFKGRHQAQPSSPDQPWKLCIYADEATVGNLLRVDNTRKAWLVYWGIVDMGAQFLSHENNWMLLGVLRWNECKKLMGGISGALRAALAQLYLGVNSNFRDSGFLVRIGDGSLVGPICASLEFVLGDDAALTAFWSTKGRQAIRTAYCARTFAGWVAAWLSSTRVGTWWIMQSTTPVSSICTLTRLLGILRSGVDRCPWCPC